MSTHDHQNRLYVNRNLQDDLVTSIATFELWYTRKIGVNPSGTRCERKQQGRRDIPASSMEKKGGV